QQRSSEGSPERQASERARAFFWLRIGLAALVIGLLCVVARPLAVAIGVDDEALVRWALVGIVATALSSAVSAMLQATGASGRMSSLTLINTGLTAVLALGLAALGRLDLLAALIVLGLGTSLV